MPSFVGVIQAFIHRERLFESSQRYLVALSGGPDSVCLLRVLTTLGYAVVAAHCNFHLRGAESDRDQLFCASLCQTLNIPLYVRHFDTMSYSRERRMSVEMAAREQRYTFFDELIACHDLSAVAVAHHKNDAIETFFLNLLRGTGLAGLQGIRVRNGLVVRPLLCVTRAEIVDYLYEIGQDYVVDSTNSEEIAMRNIVRGRVIPACKCVTPQAEDNLLRTMSYISASVTFMNKALDDVVSTLVHRCADGRSIDIASLMTTVSAEVVLWHILQDYGFTSPQTMDIYSSLPSAQTGKQWYSPSHIAFVDRGKLVIAVREEADDEAMTIPKPGVYIYKGVRYSFSTTPIDASFTVVKRATAVSIDADKVSFPLVIRRWQRGDTFIPYGMTGHKLLSDYLTDRKMSVVGKRRQRVITDKQGTIIWVIGHRIDARYAVTATSQEALMITMEE